MVAVEFSENTELFNLNVCVCTENEYVTLALCEV